MARMQLSPVAAPGGHYGRLLAVGVVAVAIVVVALIGTNILQINQPERLPAGVVGPSVTATPTPTPRPAPVAVTGTTSCDATNNGATTTDGEVTQTRGIVYQCSNIRLSDPRVQGTSVVNISVDEYADSSAAIWGTEVLTMKDGTWEGSWAGIVEKGYGTHRIAEVLVGTGAYAGLQYRLTVTSNDAGLTSTVNGTIEPVPAFQPSAPVTGPVTVTGTETCTAYGGTRTTAGGVEQVRGEGSSCTETMSDPRAASSLSTRKYDYDIQADGTATYWGVGEVSNAGGSWTGVWTGSVDKAGTFRVDASAFAGAGGYAGLQFRLTAVWPRDASAATLKGTISPIR